MSLPHSKIKEQLQASGQWEPFVRLREHLKGEGVAAKDAWQRAYQGVLRGETAPEPESPKKPMMERLKLTRSAFEGKKASTPMADVLWAYHSMELDDVDFADAPSPGAVALLRWARNEPGEFFRMFGQSVLKRDTGGDDERDVMRHLKRQTSEITRMLEALNVPVLQPGPQDA